MMQARAKISVTGLALDYPDADRGTRHRAVENLDLDVAADEFLCVLGPSGCGKSTLLAAIAGFIRPTLGSILMDGKPVTGPGADRGVVFQEYALLPWMNVLDNAALGLKLRGMPKAQRHEQARRFLALANLGGVERKYPHELSGGMKQRVAVARTLANTPEVMLMDEPFAAVDAQTREILQFELLRIWEERPTAMIFVTHSIEEAVLLGHRVIVLKGRPSSIHETIDIDLPNPRTRDTLRLPRFAELRERVWNTLMREARAAEFELQK